ncbi:MAG TPA: TrkH family potassium uptake protein [Bacteroidales bacterium]|nr:potassium transporter [Bacteroidales bacterium]HOU95739.1 TrkH family potassium uptake protein [Bacteroidales bacterium]HQG52873.1 TrkH family potassium uptake protein [Bacteroidales bacterium]HQJ20192.1 TrkH family potassium uptake protein [Bacteroidales bacterium]
MINFRVITRIYGIFLISEGIMMLATALASLIMHDISVSSFFVSGIITITTGVFVYTPIKEEEQTYGNREGYLIITGVLIIFSLFGTLPFLFSGVTKNFIDAFFESVSGFTTTATTVFPDLEKLPKGILLWRSLTQWLGGLGIIFLSLYVLPVFKDSSIQLSTTDFSGQPSDKIHPRWVDTAKRLILIYIILTAVEIVLLAAGKMNFFDAVCISLSTLSTGGFSTHNNSLVMLATPYSKIIITIFMFAGGTNMSVLYYFVKKDFKKIKENSEFIFYLLLTIVFCLLISVILFINGFSPFFESIINGSFHVVSIITTTGFYTNNYILWGNFIMLIFLALMFTGGMSGSTSGGIKIGRIMMLSLNMNIEIKRLLHPDAYLPVRLNHKIIPQEIIYNIQVFIIIYLITVCISAFGISLMGYDIITSFGTAISILGNIGPGVGSFGPLNSYAGLPAAEKLFFSVLMILGRLELLAVMVFFAKSFYRR